MAVQTYELRLLDFEFPGNLEDKNANFRFVNSVRYTNKGGDFATDSSVLPGADIYWECDTGKVGDPNYVRGPDTPAGNGTFNMTAIDDWNELILQFKGEGIHAVRIKVMDVDRPDAWDKVKDVLGSAVSALLGKAKGLIPSSGTLASFSDALGSGADEVEAYLLKRLAGGDKVLFQGSHRFATPPTGGRKEIKGKGSEGDYVIGVQLNIT